MNFIGFYDLLVGLFEEDSKPLQIILCYLATKKNKVNPDLPEVVIYSNFIRKKELLTLLVGKCDLMIYRIKSSERASILDITQRNIKIFFNGSTKEKAVEIMQNIVGHGVAEMSKTALRGKAPAQFEDNDRIIMRVGGD